MSTSVSIRLQNLTAKSNAFTHIVGREEEFKRLARILLKPTHHHAVIYGEPGVGKSSLINMLSLGIAEGALPQLPSKVYLLDTAPILSLFIAGDSLHSCFDALRAQMAQLQEAIVVVEDIQLLTADDPDRCELTMELLQTITAQPGIRLIVTTTVAAFQRTFRSNYSFNRTFASLELHTLERPVMTAVLNAAAKSMAVVLNADALDLTMQFGQKYGHDRAMPDAALRLLEETVVKAAFDGHQTITAADVRATVSEREDIPSGSLTQDHSAHLTELAPRLNRAVIGQPAALNTVARTIINALLGLRDPSRPRGSFLLLGPSGVGKTETAKALVDIVYANPKALIRLDMSEYSEPHTALRLTGSPPGYVGYEEGGQLTKAVLDQPYSLVLLDEIEKAHPKLFDVFLQLLDDGRLTDSSGKTADFTETMLFATSNIGSVEIARAFQDGIDVTNPAFLQTTLMPLLLNHFRPEFINRFDGVLVYQPLSEQQLVELARRELCKLETRLAQLHISLSVPDHILGRLVHEQYNPLFGARPVKRLVSTYFEAPLAEQIAYGHLPRPAVITGSEPWLGIPN